MKILCIAGQAEHGKDTFANALKQQLERVNKKVLIIHNADYLKFIATKYFDWDGKKDEKGRRLLQQLGTEKIRNFNPDFHAESVLRIIELFKSDFDYFLIPDVRFPNEIAILKDDLDVMSVKINRVNFENSLTEEQRLHSSETALSDYEFDYILNMKSGIDNVFESTKSFIKTILKEVILNDED